MSHTYTKGAQTRAMAAARERERRRQDHSDSGFTATEPPFEEIGSDEDRDMDFGEDMAMGTSAGYGKGGPGADDSPTDDGLSLETKHVVRQGKACGFCLVLLVVAILCVLLAIAWPLYQDSTTVQEMKPKVNQVLDTAVYVSEHELMAKLVPAFDMALATWNTEGYQTLVEGFRSMHNLTTVIDDVVTAVQQSELIDQITRLTDVLDRLETKMEQLLSLHT